MGATSAASAEGRRYGGLTAEERTTRRRRQVLDAGRLRFGTVGIRDTRVADICSEAGLTERYFYESFGDIEALALAVVEEVAIETATRVLEQVETLPADDRSRGALRAFLRIVGDDPMIGRLLMIETLGNGDGLAHVRHQILAGAAGIVEDWLQAPADGPVGTSANSDDARVIGIAVAGATTELVVSWLDGRLDVTADHLADQVARLFDAAATMRLDTTAG